MLRIVYGPLDKEVKAYSLFERLELDRIARKYGAQYRFIDSPYPPYAEHPDDTFVLMGDHHKKFLSEKGLTKKGRTIRSLRKQVYSVDGTSTVITYSPDLIMVDHGLKYEIAWDLELACRHDTGWKLQVGNYRQVDDFSDAISYISKSIATPVRVVMDLETMGLNPRLKDKHIICVSITYSPNDSDVVFLDNGHMPPRVRQHMDWLLNNQNVLMCGANFKFDLHWLRCKYGLRSTNFKFDTLLAGSLLDENRSNSLETHAKVYTDMGGYSDEFDLAYDKAHMETIPRADVLQYAGGDTDACYQTSLAQRSELMKDRQLCLFYMNLLHPASRVFEKIEEEGVYVSLSEYAKLQQKLTDKMNEAESAIDSIISKMLYNKHLDRKSPTRPSLIKDYLFTPWGLNLKPKLMTSSGTEPSTSKHHLNLITEPKAQPFIKAILDYNSLQKTESTYVKGFLPHLDPETNRFYPTYNLYKGAMEDASQSDGGTLTGRLSVRDPALHQLPKHTPMAKDLRACYVAPEGYKILNADYSEIELRLIADRSGDPVMVDVYNQGLSLHAKTAAELLGVSLEEYMGMQLSDPSRYESIRRDAKAVNFGFTYGMQVNGFIVYTKRNWGLDLSLSEGQRYRDTFFNTFKKLPDWHTADITHAKMHGFVRSPLGRIRHIPLINSTNWPVRSKAERQAINSPIQSTASDLLLLSTVLLDAKYPDHKMFLMIHDSLSLYVREGEEQLWASRMREVMENLPLKEMFGWDIKIPLKVDVECGYNLRELEKLKPEPIANDNTTVAGCV